MAWAAWGLASVAHAQEPLSAQAKLVVVELFQSQGCSSCPPAEANLNAIAGELGVLALSFGVTYWDGPGWKDTFADEAYTQRQQAYARYRESDTVWTPQVYVNGRTDLVGNDRAQLDQAMAHAESQGPSLAWTNEGLTVHAASYPASPMDVWLVRYDPRTLHVAIGGGENSGRTLPQRNVVRELIHLGTWDGHERSFSLPPSPAPGLMTAALVQVPAGGAIASASIEGRH
jgi:hypothetical protein